MKHCRIVAVAAGLWLAAAAFPLVAQSTGSLRVCVERADGGRAGTVTVQLEPVQAEGVTPSPVEPFARKTFQNGSITLRTAADGCATRLALEPGLWRVTTAEPAVAAAARSGEVEVLPEMTAEIALGAARTHALATGWSLDESEFLLSGPTREDTGSGVDASVGAESAALAEADLGSSRGAAEPVAGEAVSTEAAPQLAFRGLAPAMAASESVDGLEGSQAFRGGARGMAGGGVSLRRAYTARAVSVRQTGLSRFSAAAGGAGAGTVLATSRAGAGGWHGGGLLGGGTSAWNAANPFSTAERYVPGGGVTDTLVKPEDSRLLAAVHAGGPLLWRAGAPRVWGLGSLDGEWRSFAAESGPAVPGFFALSAVQTALLRTRGVSAGAQDAALTYLNGLMGRVDRSSRRVLGFVSVDARVSSRDDLSGNFRSARFASPSGAGSGASEAVVSRGRGSLATASIRLSDVSGGWTHRFGRAGRGGGHGLNAVNQLGAGWSRDDEFETAAAPLVGEPAIGPGGFAPAVSIAGGEFVYGSPVTALGRAAYPDEGRVSVRDAVSVATRGGHVLEAGGSWSRVSERVSDLRNLAGTFSFDSGSTNGRAGGLVDWITDRTFGVNAYPNGACPSITAPVHDFCFRSFTQSFGEQTEAWVTHEFAGWALDRWRAGPGLTVEAGARYEYVLLPFPQRPNAALDSALRTQMGVAGMGAAGLTSSFPEDRNNVGPRLAVTWQPGFGGERGRWGTLRLGVGTFFGRLPGATLRAAIADTALPRSTTHIRLTPKTETVCPQLPTVGFGFPCAYVTAPPAAVAQTTSATVFAARFRLPAVTAVDVEWERALGRRVEVRLGYDGALALQLPRSRDLNIAPAAALGRYVLQGGDGRAGVSDGTAFVLPLYTARLSPQWGPVTLEESAANATWHAGVAQVRVLPWHSIAASGRYTFSRAIDYGAQAGAVPRVNGQLDPYSGGYDKGLAELNLPQQFSGSVIARAQAVRVGEPWRRALLGGWNVAAIGLAGSGRPYSYELFGGSYLPGGGESLNGAGGSLYLPTVGRNTLRMPLRWKADMRVARSWPVRRGLAAGREANVSVFAEAENVANHRNLSRVETRAFVVGAASGGSIPLVFQNAAAIAAEGSSRLPFGAAASSTTGLDAERRVRAGVRLTF